MALSAGLPLARISSQMVKQTVLAATADNNVTGSNATIHVLDCQNKATAKGFVKIYDAGSPTVGTTAPEIVFPIAASSRQVCVVAEGVTTTTGISWAFVDSGGTAGTTAVTGGGDPTLQIIATVKAGS